jgi:hypothetical protein
MKKSIFYELAGVVSSCGAGMMKPDGCMMKFIVNV